MKSILVIQGITILALFNGCASTDPVPPSTPSILVTTPQTRHAMAATLTFPAGVYPPAFQTKNGIYFKAPGNVIGRALGMTSTLAGGLFIPFKTAPDQRQAIWYDQPRGGDIVDAAMMQSAYRYPFEPPVDFQYVRSEAAYRDIPRSAPPPGM